MIPIINAAFAIETFLDGERTDETRMAEIMKKGEFLVAEDDGGRLIAAVYVELRGERSYFGMLAVDPSRQGTGLGRVMVHAAEDYCRKRGCKRMDIIVLSPRTDLPPFYQKLGYVETGEEEEFRPVRSLKEGVECRGIIMSKAL
jgi:GNAT superfamily N-acetyltransferase